jgi:2-dehydropantoate 2-reductase
MEPSPRVLILGAGAIGTYLGGSLALAGCQVTFFDRERDLDQLRQDGIVLVKEGEKHRIKPAAVVGSLSNYQPGSFNWGVLAVKTYHLQGLMKTLKPFQHQFPPLLTILNGVESEAALQSFLGAERVLAGTVTSSISREKKGTAVIERDRGVGLSRNHELSQQIAAQLELSGINVRLYSNPSEMKWSKLLSNLMGNASSAILQMTPGAIYRHPDLFRLETSQLREALMVMSALGLNPVNLPGVPIKLLSLILRYLPDRLSKPLLQTAVGSGRGEKMPSFFLDLKRGKDQSEVEALNGAVVRQAKSLNIPHPVNHFLRRILLEILSGEKSQAEFKQQPGKLLREFHLAENQRIIS